jgi:hypothetical protein
MKRLPLLSQRCKKNNWVGEIGQGLATVTVIVQQPPIKHEVKMKDFLSWLGAKDDLPPRSC